MILHFKNCNKIILDYLIRSLKYMVLFNFFLINLLLVTFAYPISEIDIFTPITSDDSKESSCYFLEGRQAAFNGSHAGFLKWPTSGTKVRIEADCMESAIDAGLVKVMAENGIPLGKIYSTDTTHVYLHKPQSKLFNGGFNLNVKVSGWFRVELFSISGKKYFSNKNNFEIKLKQFMSFGVKNNNLSIKPLGLVTTIDVENVSPYIEGIFSLFATTFGSFSQYTNAIFDSAPLAAPLDLREVLVQSSDMDDYVKNFTGISNPEQFINELLGSTSINLLVNENYFLIDVSFGDSLYDLLKKEFKKVAQRASEGLITDEIAGKLFDRIKYPLGPSALTLLSDKGYGNVNNSSPVAYSTSSLNLNFGKTYQLAPAVSDPDNDPLYFSIISPVSNGVVNVLNDGKYRFRYKPNPNFSGNDYFEYKVEDPYGLYDVGLIKVKVNENQKPIAHQYLNSVFKEYIPSTGKFFGGGLAFIPRTQDPDNHSTTLSLATSPKHGEARISQTDLGVQYIEYLPDSEYMGKEQFSYKVTDEHGLFDTALVNINIKIETHNLTVYSLGKGSEAGVTISSNPEGLNCSAYCEKGFASDSTITLNVEEKEGYKFTGWGQDCQNYAQSRYCTLTMSSSKIATVHYEPIPPFYSVKVTKTGDGTGTVINELKEIDCGDVCSKDYPSDQVKNITLQALPAENSVFSGWSGGCLGTTNCVLTTDAHHSISAIFLEKNPTTFTVNTLGDSGAGSLRSAIIKANTNPGDDTIVFDTDLSGEIILKNGSLEVTEALVIQGNGAKKSIINGNSLSRIFTINTRNNDAVMLSGLSIKNGRDEFGSGGGIQIFNGNVVIEDTVISDNLIIGGGGGGAAIRNLGTDNYLKIINTAIFNNLAINPDDEFDISDGGGIRIDKSKMVIINSTISSNRARFGGGIYNVGGEVVISNSTIVDNYAENGGGIYNSGYLVNDSSFSGSVKVGNSIISSNDSMQGSKEIENSLGSMTSLGYNLFGENSNLGILQEGFLLNSDIILNNSIDTVIGELLDNGGNTPTRLPIESSIVINAGSNLLIPSGIETDQRGTEENPRIFDGFVDIGATEYNLEVDILSITQIRSVESISSGEEYTYEILIKNNKNSIVKDVVVINSLPDSLKLLSTSSQGWVCFEESHTLRCTISKLEANTESMINIVVKVISNKIISINNRVTAISSEVETVLSNNTATDVISMTPIIDSDNDGHLDTEDDFPNDPNEWLDTDGDGVGNNADTDDDNDGLPDTWELKYNLDPLSKVDAASDLDGDNVVNLDEYRSNTNPENPDTDNDGILDASDDVLGNGLWGYACNVVHSPDNPDRKWRIDRYNLFGENEPKAELTLSVGLNRKIQSVACNPTGNKVVYSIKESKRGDYEIYELDIQTNETTQLTTNGTDDVDVTQSRDGRVIAWQKRMPDGRQAIELRHESEDGEYTSKTLASANPFVQPSLSPNGKWLSFVQLRKSSFLIIRYDIENNVYKEVARVPRRKKLYHPSITDDGNRVGWIANTSKRIYRIKNIEDDIITNILNDQDGIEHAVLTGDGANLIYSINRSGTGTSHIIDVTTLDDKLIGEVLTDSSRYLASNWSGSKVKSGFKRGHLSGKTFKSYNQKLTIRLNQNNVGVITRGERSEILEIEWHLDDRKRLILSESKTGDLWIIRILSITGGGDQYIASIVRPDDSGGVKRFIDTLYKQ